MSAPTSFYTRLGFLTAVVLFHVSGIQAQEVQKPVIAQVSVFHIHESGWSSHPLEISANSEAVFIRGSQQFRDSGGATHYCSLAAEIPLEDIVKIEARAKSNLLSFSNTYATQLRIEFKDEKGKNHGYDFVSRDAVQRQNGWYNGSSKGKDLDGFVKVVQGAIDAHRQQANSASAKTPTPMPSLPIPQVETEEMPNNDSVLHVVPEAPPLSHYEVQRVRKDRVHSVTVWPASPKDHARTLITGSTFALPDLDIKTEDISSVEVRQHIVRLEDPNILIQIGGPPGPKVYEVCLQIKQNTDKKLTECFISDTAVCNAGQACQEGTDTGQKVRDLAKAIKAAVTTRSEELERAAQREKELRAKPSGLAAAIEFDDSQSFLPDHRLDAGKRGELDVKIENHGPGPAYGVKLSASADQSEVTVPATQFVGDIPVGEMRSVRVPVTAGLGIPDGNVNIFVEARENRGQGTKVDVIIPTARLVRPALSVASYEIGTTPRNGETFELAVYVHNNGSGPSVGTKLSVTNVPPSVVPARLSADLGVIQPGQTAEGKLAFSLPRNWSASSLDIGLKVSDGRGESVAVASRDLSLKAATHTPILNASARLLSNGHEISALTNGQTAEIEIVPQNEGELEATDVAVGLSAPGITLRSSQARVGAIRPSEKQVPLRFEFSLPRGFSGERLPVSIELTQRDFPARTIRREFAVKCRAPLLRADLVVLDSIGQRVVEQNRAANLELSVINDGDLPAEDVVAKILANTSGIRAIGPTDVRLGTIRAHDRSKPTQFTFEVLSSAAPGQLPVQISISQADFAVVTSMQPLEVRAAQTKVVRVTPTETGTTTVRHALPVIAPFVPHEVNEGTVRLAGTIADEHGIRRVSIAVNDTPVSDDVVRNGITRRRTAQGQELAELAVDIPLIPGKNTVTITAYNMENERDETSVVVNRLEDRSDESTLIQLVGLADVDQFILSSTPTRLDEKRWAVIIGIEKYRRAVPPATFADRDAIAMRQYAIKLLGVPSNHVFLLLDSDATKTDIEDLLEGRMRSLVRAGDKVYFYFSGHGFPGGESDGPYLLPSDGNPESVARTGFSIPKLFDDLAALHADKSFVFLDACFSGLHARTGKLGSLNPGTKAVYRPVNQSIPPGVMSLSAASPNQVSNTYEANAHGLFTYFLLDGLRKGYGLVELTNYVTHEVDRESHVLFGETRSQRPTVLGAADQDIPLAQR